MTTVLRRFKLVLNDKWRLKRNVESISYPVEFLRVHLTNFFFGTSPEKEMFNPNLILKHYEIMYKQYNVTFHKIRIIAQALILTT